MASFAPETAASRAAGQNILPLINWLHAAVFALITRTFDPNLIGGTQPSLHCQPGHFTLSWFYMKRELNYNFLAIEFTTQHVLY